MALSPVIPTMRYRDAPAAIDFLVNGLEFRLTARYPKAGEQDTDDEVDRLFRRAVDAGATTVIAPRNGDYGGRGAAVRDAEDHTWSMGSHRPDV